MLPSIHIHSIVLWLLQHIARNIGALPLDFFVVLDNIALRTLARRCFFVKADYDTLSFGEIAVQVFEAPIRSLRVEEVHNRNEAGVQDGPDDVESPADVFDAYRGDEHNCESVNFPAL